VQIIGSTYHNYLHLTPFRDIEFMPKSIIIYYDNEPNYGVNATCTDWPFRNEFFKSMAELRAYALHEYGPFVKFVEITAENYDQLCVEGIFYV